MQADQTTTFLIIVAAAVIILALIWFLLRRRATARLRERYGEEYDRTVERVGGRGKAERNLAEREQRVSQFRIRPLAAEERDRFSGEWQEAKTLFVDSPQEAVLRADRLLGTMMEQRGFPVEDFDRRYEDLTVHHGEVASHYREGRGIADKGSTATTEEMRRALNHYEKLFVELVRDAEEPVASGQESSSASGAGAVGTGPIGTGPIGTGEVDTSVTYDGAERPIRPS